MSTQCSQEVARASFGPVSESRDPCQGLCLADTSINAKFWNWWSIFREGSGRFYEELSHNTTAALKPKLELIYVRYQAAASTQTYEHQTESRRSANFTLTLSQKHAPGLGPPKFKHLSKACLTFTHDGKQEGDEGKSEGHNSPPPRRPSRSMKGITRKPRKLWQLQNFRKCFRGTSSGNCFTMDASAPSRLLPVGSTPRIAGLVISRFGLRGLGATCDSPSRHIPPPGSFQSRYETLESQKKPFRP